MADHCALNSSLPLPCNIINGLETAYFIITAIMSCLSLIGCFTIILTYLAFHDLHTKGRQLLVYLTLADMLTAIGNIMGITWGVESIVGESKDYSPALCKAHAALTAFSSVSSFLWNVCIAVYLYVTLVKNNHHTAGKMTNAFHIICWAVPAIVTCSALIVDVFGPDHNNPNPSWCWIDSGLGWPQSFIWQLVSGKAWEMLAYALVACLYTVVRCYLLRQRRLISAAFRIPTNGSPATVETPRQSDSRARNSQVSQGSSIRGINSGMSMVQDANRKMLFVPLVFICLRIWGTLRFIIGAIDRTGFTSGWSIWLAPLQGAGDSGQGFANAVLFCVLVPRVRQHIVHALCGHSCQSCKGCNTATDELSSLHHQNSSHPGDVL